MNQPLGAPSPGRGTTRRTVAEVVRWYFANDTAVKSAETKMEKARVLCKFCEFSNSAGRLLGTSCVDECTGADLAEFLNVAFAGCKQWTRCRVAATIKRPFNLATRLGLINSHPFGGVSERRGERGRDITWTEYRAILRSTCPAFRRALIFLRFTGARPGELMSLEWAQIDWEARHIVKRHHKTEHSTDDGAPRIIRLNGVCMRLLLWLKKTNSPEWLKGEIKQLNRLVHDPSLPPARRGHASRRRKILCRLLRRWSVSPWVFVNTRGDQWAPHVLMKTIWRLRTKLGLPPDVRLYGCRHGFATEAIVNGVDVATLASLMGHNSILTTQRYVHLAGKRAHLSAAVEKAVTFGGATPAAGPSLADLEKQIAALTAMIAALGKKPA